MQSKMDLNIWTASLHSCVNAPEALLFILFKLMISLMALAIEPKLSWAKHFHTEFD